MNQLLVAVVLCIAGALAIVRGFRMLRQRIAHRTATAGLWNALRRAESLRLSV